MRLASPLLTLVLLVPAASARADELVLMLDPARSEVAFDLPATGHDVHGEFALRGGEIRFDPATGAASGEIVVDAAAGRTGNASRDRTMREKVLEAVRFPEVRFRAERLVGTLPAEGAAELTLEGRLVLHGVEHPLALPARVTRAGSRLEAETTFPVPFLDWGLEDPSLLFLRVERVVAVRVRAAGVLQAAGEAIAAGL